MMRFRLILIRRDADPASQGAGFCVDVTTNFSLMKFVVTSTPAKGGSMSRAWNQGKANGNTGRATSLILMS